MYMYRRILARKNYYNASPFHYMSTSSLDAVSTSKQGTSVGFFYNNLLYKGRQKNRLALGDLRKLLEQCVDPDHIKYVSLGIKLYQKKGHDFSEEVASHFVQACVRLNNIDIAVETVKKTENRISAWITPKAANQLIENLASGGKIDSMIDVAEVLLKKRTPIKVKDSLEQIMKAISTSGTEESYKRSIDLFQQYISREDMELLINTYPVPPPSKDKVIEETVESTPTNSEKEQK